MKHVILEENVKFLLYISCAELPEKFCTVLNNLLLNGSLCNFDIKVEILLVTLFLKLLWQHKGMTNNND